MSITKLDKIVEEWFLDAYGADMEMKKIYDAGTGYAAQVAALEKDRQRLQDDRDAGLYDEPDRADWFRTKYLRMGEEIKELKALPERAPGMRTIPTGRTVADMWKTAQDDAARRELLTSFNVRVVLHPARGEKRSTSMATRTR